MAFDVTRLRTEFPILQQRINDAPLHYLDNGATAQTPQAVINAVLAHETMARANVLRGVHTLAERATDAYEAARGEVAAFVGARDVSEVIFTGGTTASLNLVARSLGETLGEGDEVVISLLEHHSNFVPWQMLRERKGIVLKVVPITIDGVIDLDALEMMLSAHTKLISLAHVSNVTGAILDVPRVVTAAKGVGALVMLDGAQAVPHGPVDVAALGIDLYAFSGHKMYGPNGIGVLWGRAALLDDMPPFLGGGEMIREVTLEKTTYAPVPHKFEAGTPPIAQAVGLGAACRWMHALDLGGAGAHMTQLCTKALEGLKAIDDVTIKGPAGSQDRAPVISFTIEGLHPHDICTLLDRHGVALRGGHHCAQPLMDHWDLDGTTRASLTFCNDDADIDAMLSGLDEAISLLR
jgi:cysteine desulfurase/selenocysteine lyase